MRQERLALLCLEIKMVNIEELTKKFGKTVIHKGVASLKEVEGMSTGSFGLDKASGIGGYPKGRIVEIFGPEHSGKTTLAIHAMAECQRAGGTVAFIDVEHALDFVYASAIGVNTDALIIAYPENAEQALDIACELTKSHDCDLIVLDSVAALVPKAELEGDMEKNHVGLQARVIGQGVRKIVGSLHKTETTFIFINQLRMKVGVMFGNPETRPGGKALDYATSMMLDIRRGKPILEGEDNILGYRTKVKFTKNKVGGQPGAKVEFDIMWGAGVSYMSELFDVAVDSDIIEKSGAWYAYAGSNIGQGKVKALAFLDENPTIKEEILAKAKEV